MRKFILLLSVSFFSIAGYTQFVVFGVKAGPNLSTFTANYLENPRFIPSFHAGGFANFMVNDNIFVQADVIYSGKGAKYETGTSHFGYVNIPIMGQYKTASGFFVEAGPQVGFLIHASTKLNGQSSTDVKSDMKSTDFSWVFGLGYKITDNLGVGARYDFGYYNVAKAGTIKNKTILLSVFYTLGASEN